MREEEIRKRDIFDQYLALVERDVEQLFCFDDFIEVPCPGCGSKTTNVAFLKLKFAYVQCRDCGTLFVNPRPRFETLKKFYKDSPSTNYWVKSFYAPVAEVRREKIFAPRADYLCSHFPGLSSDMIGDVGAGFGLFLEEMRRRQPQNSYIAIEPSFEMAEICRQKGFEVYDLCCEDLSDKEEAFDLLTVFELTEHLFDPAVFFEAIYGLLKPGGRLVLTTLNGHGFDIQLLWEKSRSVFPPHHLNFFNPCSLCILLERLGFIIREVSTPGQLDWDIVEGAITRDGIHLGRFWDLVATQGQECQKQLQQWIVANKLSSHMRVVACKPESS